MSGGLRDVVVLIPGIAGSVLRRDGNDIWAPDRGDALKSALSLGNARRLLALDGDDPSCDSLGDGVTATRLVPDFHVVPGLNWKIDGYERIRTLLRETLGCREGANYFELPYDWRRDNRVAARLLQRKAWQWLKAWREQSGNPGAKLILIGHSMGGIVARLFIELLEGWKLTRTLVTLGTPYSGSVNAADFLFNGFRPAWARFTSDLSTLLRSLTSIYQLLPSYRCLRTDDGGLEYLDSQEWNTPGVDDMRLREAIALQRAVRQAVDDRCKTHPDAYVVRPIIGDFQPTLCAVRRAGAGIEALYQRHPGSGEGEGDGTVPRISASPHELLTRYDNAVFSSQLHGSLQNDANILRHVVGAVGGGQDEARHAHARGEAVALVFEDTIVGEPFVVRARPRDPDRAVVVSLENVLGEGAARLVALGKTGADGWQEAVLEGLPPADYRVRVTGAGLAPVTAVASLVDPRCA